MVVVRTIVVGINEITTVMVIIRSKNNSNRNNTDSNCRGNTMGYRSSERREV